MIAQSQSEMEELVESYSNALPDEPATLNGAERHKVYRILSLRVALDNTGIVELSRVAPLLQKKDHIEISPET
jgi:hypothetical protein